MLAKIATAVFFLGMTLFMFHVEFPYLEVLIGVAALILGVLAIL